MAFNKLSPEQIAKLSFSSMPLEEFVELDFSGMTREQDAALDKVLVAGARDPAAVSLGRKGGSVISLAKAAAARRNGLKGGPSRWRR